MALVESNTNLGMTAPDFELQGTDGDTYTRDSFADSQVLVVMFICNHCPYVKAVRQRLIDLANRYGDQQAAFVAISSNDPVRYPDDSFDRMKEVAEEYGYPFPYLFDEKQEVAESYDAQATPDLYVFDSERVLVYRGRLDDNWKDPQHVTSHDLRDAIDAVLAGQAPDEDQKPSMGCSIKWKH